MIYLMTPIEFFFRGSRPDCGLLRCPLPPPQKKIYIHLIWRVCNKSLPIRDIYGRVSLSIKEALRL